MYLVCYITTSGDNYAGGEVETLKLIESLDDIWKVWAPISWVWRIDDYSPLSMPEIETAAATAKGRQAALAKAQQIAALERQLMDLKRS